MHNCKTAHPKKTHRRRNRGLRTSLNPLHWWSHPKRKTHWAMGAFTHIVDASGNRPRPGKIAIVTAPNRTPDAKRPSGDEKLITAVNASLAQRFGSGIRRFFNVKRSS